MNPDHTPKQTPPTRVFVVTHEGKVQCVVTASGPIQAGVLAVDALKSKGVTDEVLSGAISEGWPMDSDVTEVDQSKPNAITLD